MIDKVYSLGLGFGVDAIGVGNQETDFQVIAAPLPVPTTEPVQAISQKGTQSLSDKVLGAILGKDEMGNPKTLDLGSLIKLPTVNVKAENSQWWIIALIVGGVSFIGYHLFKKQRR